MHEYELLVRGSKAEKMRSIQMGTVILCEYTDLVSNPASGNSTSSILALRFSEMVSTLV